MIGDDKVAEIRERTDVVALIGEYVTLKRAGSSFRGLCPFHSEKSPSFYVHPARQFFHCFGCQASGDGIAFVMRLEGRTFPDALRFLAERAGVELPSEDQREDQGARRERQRRERLYAVADAAAGYFVRMLAEHPHAPIAQRELEKRRVGPEFTRLYRLGYAPSGWDGLTRFLAQKGFSTEDAEQAGLILPRRTGDGHYDRFRHRLMFSIADVHGKVVAFSGRALDPPPGEAPPNEPPAKYVNSPEGPLYKKGELLFGLHEARVELRRTGVAFLCEGNFDVVALAQAGFTNVVAPLGTAFTAPQAKLLRRYAARVNVIFDGDRAGRKAVQNAYPLLTEAGLAAKVIALPQGDDPDSFLRTRGAPALTALVDRAPPILDHLIEQSAEDAGNDPTLRAQAIEGLGPFLAKLANPVEAGLYVERIAQAFAVKDVEAVRRQLRRGARGGPTTRPTREREPAAAAAPRPRPPLELPPVEADLVGAYLDQPLLLDVARLDSLRELFTANALIDVLDAIADVRTDDGNLDATKLLDRLGAEADGRPWLETRLATSVFDADGAAHFVKNALPLLRKQRIERDQAELTKRILEARRNGDEPLALELSAILNDLLKAARAMQRR